jgi:hypothetical protein
MEETLTLDDDPGLRILASAASLLQILLEQQVANATQHPAPAALDQPAGICLQRCLRRAAALLHVYVHAGQRAAPPALMVCCCVVVLVPARCAVCASMQEAVQEAMRVPMVLLLTSFCMHMRHVPVAMVCMRRVRPCLWPYTHVCCMVVTLWRGVHLLPLLLLQALLVLQLCHAPPLPLVCVPHCTLGCCDGGTVGCCVKGFEALEGHLLACRSTQQ